MLETGSQIFCYWWRTVETINFREVWLILFWVLEVFFFFFFLRGWMMEGIIFHCCVLLDLGFWWAIKIEEVIVSCRYSPNSFKHLPMKWSWVTGRKLITISDNSWREVCEKLANKSHPQQIKSLFSSLVPSFLPPFCLSNVHYMFDMCLAPGTGQHEQNRF